MKTTSNVDIFSPLNKLTYQQFTQTIFPAMLKLINQVGTAIENGTIKNFDPLVGDVRCHMRTLFIVKFFKDAVILDTIRKDVKRLEKITIPNKTTFEGKNNFNYYVNSLKLNLECSGYTRALLYSRLLTLTRSKQNRMYTDYRGIQALSAKFSRSQCKRIGEAAKIKLCQISIDFLKQITNDQGLTNAKVISDKNRRTTLPFYLVTKAIVDFQVRNGRYIVLLIKKNKTTITQIFIGDGKKFNRTTLTNQKEVVCVYQGISTSKKSTELLLKQIDTIGLREIILMAAAHHSQGIGDNENVPTTNDFIKIKQRAETLGCCVVNTSLFCVKHVYAASIKELPGEIK